MGNKFDGFGKSVQPIPPEPPQRKKGKSSNPDEWRQRSILVHKATDLAVISKLYGTKRDFSELVDELLRRWLDEQVSGQTDKRIKG